MMINYSAKDIASVVNGQLVGNGENSICRISTDSRTLTFPEETAFFALRTKRADGASYIKSLYERGVRCFVCSAVPANVADMQDADFIVAADTLNALQQLATHKRKQCENTKVIAITGSNGKTIVKEWLNQLIGNDCKVVRSPRSYNSQIGVPLSLWEIAADTDVAIIEAGISEPNEMQRLKEIINPDVVVFTHLGEAHSENFESMKHICIEKLQLASDSKSTLIYNGDNKLVDICARQLRDKNEYVNFCCGAQKNADCRIVSRVKTDSATTISYSIPSRDIEGEYTIPMTDEASIENSISCLATLVVLGYSDAETIAKRMSQLEPTRMRLEVKSGTNGCIVINDSYNSDLSSLAIALDVLSAQSKQSGHSRTLILSDILQSGLSAEDLYSQVNALLEEKSVDRLIGVGSEISKLQSVFSISKKSFYQTTDQLLSSINSLDFEQEVILIKGSRSFRLEEVSDALSAAVHETVLEVNLSALERNYRYFRSKLRRETKMVCMVKANAYGSGDVEVAKCLQAAGADYLAVAVADEGEALRKAGIYVPIIVMNPEMNSFAKIFEYHLEPEVYSFNVLEKMISEASREGLTDYPFHLKIDTGMHRLGFDPSEVNRVISRLKQQNNITPRSVFSHLVGSDSPDFDAFTLEQIRRFTLAKDEVQAAYPGKVLAHILNSAGIERFADYQFDMVRLGIGHYGMSALPSVQLEEVCTLKTKILQIRNVDKSETVGYSRKGKLTHDSVIGAIPIGYADGLDRHLGNRCGEVLVGGRRAPIVGNVCMDVCMIDLTGIDAKEGDEVIIFGAGLSINEVAAKLSTISYEVLSGIARRVKRVYVRE